MPREVRLPKLAEGDAAGTVARVLVKPGDRIEEGQTILEVEAEKAVVEVPAETAGVVKELLVHEGDEVKNQQVILTLEESGEEKGAEVAGEAAAAGTKGAPAKEKGEEKGEEEPQEEAKDEEEEEKAEPAPRKEEAPAAQVQEAVPAAEEDGQLLPAAPSVRRFARELGVPLSQVRGSGPEGRILMEDVKRFVRERPTSPQADGGAPLPDFSKWGPVRREKMTAIRKATARHLSQVWRDIPQVTHFDEADITEVEAFRRSLGPSFEKEGAKLTVTAILVKVAAVALRQFPRFNCSIDMASEEIIYKDYVHIGVAVDTPHGLLVPAIRQADQKGLLAIAKELGELADKARQRKLTLEEMQGATFSISNLGGLGGTGFTPVVDGPQVAILGVGRAEVRPLWRDGQWVPRTVLPLMVTYDHRIIDGADAARFLRWVAEALEQPLRLLMEG
ncbi:MAG: 2-oxo acid dehydrogenase subunit E2 [Bacillota bacterium]|nr:2-oxo acid dehydrogenase subunit E2 [Bacillota bacterium]